MAHDPGAGSPAPRPARLCLSVAADWPGLRADVTSFAEVPDRRHHRQAPARPAVAPRGRGPFGHGDPGSNFFFVDPAAIQGRAAADCATAPPRAGPCRPLVAQLL